MIKSKNNAYGFWLLVVSSLIFLIGIIATISQAWFHKTILKINPKDANQPTGLLTILFCSFILFICLLLYYVERIVIDATNKTISFKNLFLPITKTYSFSDLDGFFEKNTSHEQLYIFYRTICLVQNERVVKKIDSFFYSNFEELKSGLKALKYLGFKKFDFWGNEKKEEIKPPRKQIENLMVENPLPNTASITGLTKISPEGLTIPIAIFELNHVKEDFQNLIKNDTALADSMSGKNVEFILAYDNGSYEINICKESMGQITWFKKLKS